MKCNNCNQIIPDDSKFCPDCGTKIVKEEIQAIDDTEFYYPFIYNELFGFKDIRNGAVVIQPQFKFARKFQDGLAYVSDYEDDGCYINKFGDVKIYIDPNRSSEEFLPLNFSEGFACISKDTIIGKNGNLVVSIGCDFEICGPVSNGLYRVKHEDGLYGFFSINSDDLIPPVYLEASDFHKGIALVKVKDNTYRFIKPNGQNAFNRDFYDANEFCCGIAYVVYYDERSAIRHEGFINENGNEVIIDSNFYFGTSPMCSDGLLRVEEYGSGWSGFIDKYCNLVIPSQYEKADNFHHGMAWVNDGCGKYGKIDKRGRMVVPFEYDFASYDSDGLSLVIKDERSGFMDLWGNVLWVN